MKNEHKETNQQHFYFQPNIHFSVKSISFASLIAFLSYFGLADGNNEASGEQDYRLTKQSIVEMQKDIASLRVSVELFTNYLAEENSKVVKAVTPDE